MHCTPLLIWIFLPRCALSHHYITYSLIFPKLLVNSTKLFLVTVSHVLWCTVMSHDSWKISIHWSCQFLGRGSLCRHSHTQLRMDLSALTDCNIFRFTATKCWWMLSFLWIFCIFLISKLGLFTGQLVKSELSRYFPTLPTLLVWKFCSEKST